MWIEDPFRSRSYPPPSLSLSSTHPHTTLFSSTTYTHARYYNCIAKGDYRRFWQAHAKAPGAQFTDPVVDLLTRIFTPDMERRITVKVCLLNISVYIQSMFSVKVSLN